jgi:hypothetical protein
VTLSLQGPGAQNNPDGLADLMAVLRGALARIGELERGAQLRTAGISVAPGGMTINSALSVLGSMAISGTLSLPAGIIDNATLASPTVFGSVGVSASNFAVTSAGGNFGSTNITVPAGFTQVTVLCLVDASVYNTSGSGDYIYLSTSINAVAGGENVTWAPNAYSTGLSASGIRTMTVTPGSTFPVAARLHSGTTSIPAQPSTKADVNAIALFLR